MSKTPRTDNAEYARQQEFAKELANIRIRIKKFDADYDALIKEYNALREISHVDDNNVEDK